MREPSVISNHRCGARVGHANVRRYDNVWSPRIFTRLKAAHVVIVSAHSRFRPVRSRSRYFRAARPPRSHSRPSSTRARTHHLRLLQYLSDSKATPGRELDPPAALPVYSVPSATYLVGSIGDSPCLALILGVTSHNLVVARTAQCPAGQDHPLVSASMSGRLPPPVLCSELISTGSGSLFAAHVAIDFGKFYRPSIVAAQFKTNPGGLQFTWSTRSVRSGYGMVGGKSRRTFRCSRLTRSHAAIGMEAHDEVAELPCRRIRSNKHFNHPA